MRATMKIRGFLEWIERHMAYIGGAWFFLELLRLASIYRCPKCNRRILEGEKCCRNCDQKINWKGIIKDG